jgi:hypothetical protein
MRLADGVDRRQVDHVETECGDLRQAPRGVRERAVNACFLGLRARKQLVPRSEARLRPIDDQLVERRARELGRLERPEDLGDELLVERRAQPLVEGRAVVQHRRLALAHAARRIAAEQQRETLEQQRTDHELGPHVLPRVDALLQLPAPGAEVIGPRFDTVVPAPERIDLERAVPAIGIVLVPELRRAPLRLPRRKIDHARSDQIVPVAEHVGADLERAAARELHGIASSVDRRCHLLDHDARGLGSGSHLQGDGSYPRRSGRGKPGGSDRAVGPRRG